mmetsp:Transcript_16410/g.16577  ORF Transcript_16410/g.16577 Transcript_16410/m.16577 type:complete len:81 (-) Transcript_16410:438-680(-)
MPSSRENNRYPKKALPAITPTAPFDPDAFLNESGVQNAVEDLLRVMLEQRPHDAIGFARNFFRKVIADNNEKETKNQSEV